MIIPIGSFYFTYNRNVLFACDGMYNKFQLDMLIVMSFGNYYDNYNAIMIMVSLIGNIHIRYNSGVLFACAGMYDKFLWYIMVTCHHSP